MNLTMTIIIIILDKLYSWDELCYHCLPVYTFVYNKNHAKETTGGWCVHTFKASSHHTCCEMKNIYLFVKFNAYQVQFEDVKQVSRLQLACNAVARNFILHSFLMMLH